MLLLRIDADSDALKDEINRIATTHARHGKFASKIYLNVDVLRALCHKCIPFCTDFKLPQQTDMRVVAVIRQGDLTSGYVHGVTNRLDNEEKVWFGTDITSDSDLCTFIEYVHARLLECSEILLLLEARLNNVDQFWTLNYETLVFVIPTKVRIQISGRIFWIPVSSCLDGSQAGMTESGRLR